MLFIIAMLSVGMSVLADTREDFSARKRELRIGWGDQLFESLMWHNPTSVVTTLPDTYSAIYHEDYSYHQHLWIEYNWRSSYWFSLGALADVSEVGWNDVTRNGRGIETARSPRKYFCNIVVMPTIRFTYFHHPNVNIHSGLGLGLDVNTGTEMNAAGEKTDFGLAVNLTILGFSFNYDRWFMGVDFGGMTALKEKNAIYMAMSRMINVSVGARF